MSDSAFDRLLSQTMFSRDELLNIHQNYKQLSSSITDDGVIDKSEFQQLMACHGDTIFVDSLFRMFDRDNSGSVDFDEFVMALAIYQSKSKNVSEHDKLKLFFRIFDANGDGEISEGDLSIVLRSCFKSNFMCVGEEDISALVKATMAKYTLTSSGAINFDSYASRALQNKSVYV